MIYFNYHLYYNVGRNLIMKNSPTIAVIHEGVASLF